MRVEHRLLALVRLAAHLDALDARLEGRREFLRVDVRLTLERAARLHERRAVERAGGATDVRNERHADALEDGAEVLVCELRQLLLDGREAAREVDAVVAVADGIVELREEFLLLLHALGDRLHDFYHFLVVDHTLFPRSLFSRKTIPGNRSPPETSAPVSLLCYLWMAAVSAGAS